MSATRLLRMSRTLGLGQPCYSFSNRNHNVSILLSKPLKISCISKAGFNGSSGTRPPGGSGGDRQLPAAKALCPASQFEVTTETKMDKGVLDLAFLLGNFVDFVLQRLKFVTKSRPWKLHAQMFVEKVIIDCRFFTLFAVAGSLLGSALCFAEGCFLVAESYLQYLHVLTQISDQGHIMQLLIEALDMFLVGTAMLTFGMSIYVMFVGSKKQSQLEDFSSYELPYLKALPSSLGVRSVMQAKSKIGQAVLMLLQVGVMEKFKSIPLVTGPDLACFAGAVFVSSASTFLLSRLTMGSTTPQRQQS